MKNKAAKKILISYFGYEHDKKGTDVWRPSVALASYPDLKFDDYYLLYSGLKGDMQATFGEVVEDIGKKSPRTQLHLEKMSFYPWGMIEVFKALYRFAEEHSAEFGAQDAECYVNCNHGTMQIRESLFMLTQEGKLPGLRILPSPWHDNTKRDYHTAVGSYALDDPKKFNDAYRQLSSETKRRAKNNGLHDGIFIDKSNREFSKLLDRILFVAQRTKEPILFTGPTGSGKTQLAKNIAKIKGLSENFVHVNCATLSGDPGLVKSELFGHDKGDFTGATESREGRLQQANGGLLFLDEIAELPKEVQPMLLTAIEDKKIRRPHSKKTIQCDFMLICGTNRDLRTEVAKGNFRRDLLERINTWHFRIPGLSDTERPGWAGRRKDLRLNCEQVLEEFNAKYKRHLKFAEDALRHFVEYAGAETTKWEGNFREFNAMIFRMATLADGLQITVKDVDREIEYATREHGFEESVEADAVTDVQSPAPQATNFSKACKLDYSPLRKLIPDKFDDTEPIALVHLMYVVSVCRESRTLLEASQKLRTTHSGKTPNGASGQLSKYLKNFGLSFRKIREKISQTF